MHGRAGAFKHCRHDVARRSVCQVLQGNPPELTVVHPIELFKFTSSGILVSCPSSTSFTTSIRPLESPISFLHEPRPSTFSRTSPNAPSAPSSHHVSCTTRKFPQLDSLLHLKLSTPTILSLAAYYSREITNVIQVDPDEIIHTLHDHPSKAHKHHVHTKSAVSTVTPYSSRYASQQEISKFKIPQEGAPADAVHQMLKDELDLDGRPNLNLASFVGTYMEREAEALMVENLSKNMSDADEYPAMMAMHARCVSIISHLWGVQKGETAIGSATTGSSEAIHLGGLAMKRRWQEKRDKEGKDKSKPNIIMGSNAQVALEKFARYFEVEARILDVSEESLFRLDPELVKKNIDENTIGVFVIMGSTYTGHYEPVEEISKILDEYEKKTGNDIPIHVDAASGGFIAPFTYAHAGGSKW